MKIRTLAYLILFCSLFAFYMPSAFGQEAASEPNPQTRKASPQQQTPDQHTVDGAGRPASANGDFSLIEDSDKNAKLKQLAKDLVADPNKSPQSIFDTLTEIFNNSKINVTEVSRKADALKGNYDLLKMYLKLESLSIGKVQKCMITLQIGLSKEELKTKPEELKKLAEQEKAMYEQGIPQASECGLTEKTKAIFPQVLVAAGDKKIREWAYVLGVPLDRAAKFLMETGQRLEQLEELKKIENTKEGKEHAKEIESAKQQLKAQLGYVLANFLGTKPLASRESILRRLENVPLIEEEATLRMLLNEAVRWSQKEETPKEGTIQAAFNASFFHSKEGSAQSNRETFWGLVDKAKADPSAKTELLKKYSQNLPTFIRTLHEQAEDPAISEGERKKAKDMLNSILDAIGEKKDGKRFLNLADKSKPEQVRAVDTTGDNFGELLTETGYRDNRPRTGRYIPLKRDDKETLPSIYATSVASDGGKPSEGGHSDGGAHGGDEHKEDAEHKPETGQKPDEEPQKPKEDDHSGYEEAKPPQRKPSEITQEEWHRFIGGSIAGDVKAVVDLPEGDAKTAPQIKELVKKYGTSVEKLDALLNLATVAFEQGSPKQNLLIEEAVNASKGLRRTKIDGAQSKLPSDIAPLLTEIVTAPKEKADELKKKMADQLLAKGKEDEREAVYDYLYHQTRLNPEKWQPYQEALQDANSQKASAALEKQSMNLPEGERKAWTEASLSFSKALYNLLITPRDSAEFQLNTQRIRDQLKKLPAEQAAGQRQKLKEMVEMLGFGDKGKHLFEDPVATSLPPQQEQKSADQPTQVEKPQQPKQPAIPRP